MVKSQLMLGLLVSRLFLCFIWSENIRRETSSVGHLRKTLDVKKSLGTIYIQESPSLWLLAGVLPLRGSHLRMKVGKKVRPCSLWEVATWDSLHLPSKLLISVLSSWLRLKSLVGMPQKLLRIAYEFGWTPGVGDGQGGLACCDSWSCKESDMTERLNWLTDLWAHEKHIPDSQ